MIRIHRFNAIFPIRLSAACAALACVYLLGLSAPALGATGAVSVLGGPSGSGEAQFLRPSGVAVSQAGGDVYVVDSGNNRIQEFTEDGSFIRTWGNGVTASGPDHKTGVDEVKSLVIPATSGTFKLSFGGIDFFGSFIFGGEPTVSLDVGASALAVEAALQALPQVGAKGGVIAVTGAGTVADPYTFTFEGSFGGVKEVLGYEYSANPEPGFFRSATTLTSGSSPFEECVAADGDTCAAGQASAEAGGMNGPLGLAVDQTTGNVYVTDEGNHRVDVFSSTGEFEGAWGWGVSTGKSELEFCTAPSQPTECRVGETGSGAGEFGGAIGFPAVDPTTGDVDVADPANGRIDQFSVATSAGKVTSVEFARSFEHFEPGSPVSVAVDNEGGVYALLGRYPGGVEKLDSAGEPVASFATEQLSGEPAPSAIAVNPGTDRVLALRQCNATICPEAPSTAWRIFEFDTLGNSLTTYEHIELNPGLREWHQEIGLAAGSSDANIYVTAAGWLPTENQSVFTLNTPVPPTVTVAPASGVGSSEAVLHGTVTPNENALNRIQTEYQFEYSLDGQNWTPVPGVGKVAAGMTPTPVEQTVTGLESNTVYHVRLHASKEFAAGSETSSNTTEFKTESAPPTVAGLSTPEVEAGSVLVEAHVNPQGEETTYRFEYGVSEAYGSTLPGGEGDAGANVGDVNVRLRPEGLLPGTLYYFRMVATNARGSGEAKGTFTTAALTPPVVTTGGYSALAQNGVTISGTLDTLGLPSTYGFEVGTSTSYGPPTGLASVGAGASGASVSLSLSGLQPGTTYHYRITASSVDGTSYGADRTFTTTTFPGAFATPPVPLPFVLVPQVAFPVESRAQAVKAKTPTKKGKKGKKGKGKRGKHNGKRGKQSKHKKKK
jgi:DNA-binding beta-propeller fold protein YncE